MTIPLHSAALIVAMLLSAGAAFAATDQSHGASAAPSAPSKADYPLTTCVVSGEELGGDMGEAVDYIYKQAGQPDRLVRFCCKMCLPKFKKDPAKYLKLIDDAAAAPKAKKN